MKIRFTVNGTHGEFDAFPVVVANQLPTDLAEQAAAIFFRNHTSVPSVVDVHLLDVDGVDLGHFQVRGRMRPVFTAKALATKN